MFAVRSIGRRARLSRTGFLLPEQNVRVKTETKKTMFRNKTKRVEASPRSDLTFGGATLSRFSSLIRRRSLKRLHLRAAHRRGKFLRRKVAALSRQHRQLPVTGKSIVAAKQLAARALRPLTENLVPRATLAPLTFVRRTPRVIKTEAEKLRAIV